MEPPSAYHLALQAQIAQVPFAWTALAVALLLLPVHAWLAGMRLALLNVTAPELQVLKERGVAGAARALGLHEDTSRTRMTLRVAITIVVVTITGAVTGALAQAVDLRSSAGIGMELGGLAATVVVLLFTGEVVPKVWVERNPAQVVVGSAGALGLLCTLMRPISGALAGVSGRLERPNPMVGEDGATPDPADIEAEDGERRILRGVARFGETEVKQVMRPRNEVVAFDHALSFNELVPAVVESGFSRVPIYDGSLDKVVGILYLKDLLPLMRNTQMDWHRLLRKPYFVAESMPLDRLLREFQKLKVHLAVVVDEYGATSGIITLEDVIEEIVGDITDEYDDEDRLYVKLDDNTFLFEGRTPLPDMYRALDTDGADFEEHRGDSGTLGGFITELTGRIPKRGEEVEVGRYRLRVEASDNKRVRRVKVQLRHV